MYVVATKIWLILNQEEKVKFFKLICLLLLNGILSICSVSSIIPFMYLIVKSETFNDVPYLASLSYSTSVTISILLLMSAFILKNFVAYRIFSWQQGFLTEMASEIRVRLYKFYMHLSYESYLYLSTPDLVSTVNVEANLLSMQVISQFGNWLSELININFIILFLIFMNVGSTILLGGLLAISAYSFIRIFSGKVDSFSRKRKAANLQITKTTYQSLGAIKEVKIYGKEHYFITMLKKYAKDYAMSQKFAALYSQASRYFLEAVSVVTMLAFVWFLVMISYDRATMAILISVYGISSIQLLPSINRLIQAKSNIHFNKNALDHVVSEYQKYRVDNSYDSDCTDNIVMFKKELVANNLSYRYDKKNVLKDISLRIQAGTKIAIVGKSGAGKSTLLNILLGLLSSETGQITIDGIKLSAKNIGSWRKNIAYIPQNVYLYDLTIKENVAFGVSLEDIDTHLVNQCLEKASLFDFINNNCPLGIETLVGENGIRFSGGQRQRIIIARALYRRPKLLILDEATSALDAVTEDEINKTISSLDKNITVISVTHKIRTVKKFDQIIMMDKGRLISCGTHDSLMNSSYEYQVMNNHIANAPDHIPELA